MPRPLSLGPAGPTAGPTPLPLQPDLLAGPPVPSTHQSQQLKLLPLFLHHPRLLSRLPRSHQRRLRRYRMFKPGWRTCRTLFAPPWKTRSAPPQSSMGPAVPTRIMGTDVLRPLSSSGDRASPWAPHKSWSKQADDCSRSRSPSGDRSVSSRDGRSRRRAHSLSSSSDRLSPPSKRLRAMSHSPWWWSSSPDVSRRSPGPRRHCASPSSTDPHHSRSRTRPSLSRWLSLAGMTRRPAKDVSLSPRHSSSSPSVRRSPWGRCTSPRITRRMPLNRHSGSSCSRSSTPRPRRRPRYRSSSLRSRSPSWDRFSHPFAAEQQLLRLRDESSVPQHEEEEDIDQRSSSNDNSMSAAAVRKLFADLVCPPALSHYADPFPDAPVTNNQSVLHVKDAARSTIVSETNELNTHVPELCILLQSVRWTRPTGSYVSITWSHEPYVITDNGGQTLDQCFFFPS